MQQHRKKSRKEIKKKALFIAVAEGSTIQQRNEKRLIQRVCMNLFYIESLKKKSRTK